MEDPTGTAWSKASGAVPNGGSGGSPRSSPSHNRDSMRDSLGSLGGGSSLGGSSLGGSSVVLSSAGVSREGSLVSTGVEGVVDGVQEDVVMENVMENGVMETRGVEDGSGEVVVVGNEDPPVSVEG